MEKIESPGKSPLLGRCSGGPNLKSSPWLEPVLNDGTFINVCRIRISIQRHTSSCCSGWIKITLERCSSSSLWSSVSTPQVVIASYLLVCFNRTASISKSPIPELRKSAVVGIVPQSKLLELGAPEDPLIVWAVQNIIKSISSQDLDRQRCPLPSKKSRPLPASQHMGLINLPRATPKTRHRAVLFDDPQRNRSGRHRVQPSNHGFVSHKNDWLMGLGITIPRFSLLVYPGYPCCHW